MSNIIKIALFSIEAGPTPTDYPPVSITRVMGGILRNVENCNVYYIDQDLSRLDDNSLIKKLNEIKPDIIAYSGILTTSYARLKYLGELLNLSFPTAIQVVGGAMTVMSGIILQKTKIDYCIVGESEPTFSQLVKLIQSKSANKSNKHEILHYLPKNISALDSHGAVVYTGDGDEDFENGNLQFEYDLIKDQTDLNHYFGRLDTGYFEERFVHSNPNFFKNLLLSEDVTKTIIPAFSSKGCVARCTFCHRDYNGYKISEAQDVIDYLDKAIDERNGGLVLFLEENFGTGEVVTNQIIEYLKAKKINWGAGAVRVKTALRRNAIKYWAESGCVHLNSGIESLSEKILRIMEKKTTVAENLSFIQECQNNNIFQVVGLVIGMPGETEETINETIENFKKVVPKKREFPFELYVNYVQAIPGTPVYEYAKRIGRITTDLDSEEQYIIKLCDQDASEFEHYLNFTPYLKEEVAYWKYYIQLELRIQHLHNMGYTYSILNAKTKLLKLAIILSFCPKSLRRLILKYGIMLKYYGFFKSLQVVLRIIRGERNPFYDGSLDSSLRHSMVEESTVKFLHKGQINNKRFVSGY